MVINKSQARITDSAGKGVLVAQPLTQTLNPINAGQHSLAIETGREATLYVPVNHKNVAPTPLALLLHGAGGSAAHGSSLLQAYADESNIILLAPKSLHATWDVIADEYGVDVAFIDRTLQFVFEHCNIDENRFAVGGFSDGASYALSLGLINGQLFSHIIAFSPGFMAPTRQVGTPEIFVSHGIHDRVLPIERCSRRLVPQLKRAGYAATYREFDGPHVVPPEIAREAVEWFANG